jgi:hypothetical protein
MEYLNIGGDAGRMINPEQLFANVYYISYLHLKPDNRYEAELI